MIVDVEHHLMLEERTKKGRSASGRVVERYRDEGGEIRLRMFEAASSVESHIRFMDEAGIDVAVLSVNPELPLESCRKWNDICAEAIRKYPDRLRGFAAMAPLAGKAALVELERAIKELGLSGVHIYSRTDGHTLDEKVYWPFYEKVSELGVPIDVHIMHAPPGFDALHAPYPLYYIMAREFDLCATVLRICLGGVLEDFPDMTFIINHFGGGVSAVLERVDAYLGYTGEGWPYFYPGKPLISKPWREYFNKLYFNMAGREHGMETVECALTNIRPDRMLFATDWPFNYDNDPQGVKAYVEDIRKLDLPAEAIKGVLGANAASLLGITNGVTSGN